ncbi:MmyB family transcriptional regulator [Nonomuraea sp. KM88]|uniref:MmyB family transcriptional regulator n=1 Tax=Nonomuraea sp. KM88 TaxID=3457427 RepID=UPI003FCC731C
MVDTSPGKEAVVLLVGTGRAVGAEGREPYGDHRPLRRGAVTGVLVEVGGAVTRVGEIHLGRRLLQLLGAGQGDQVEGALRGVAGRKGVGVDRAVGGRSPWTTSRARSTRNVIRWVFMSPDIAGILECEDPGAFARSAVADLRAAAGRYPGDRKLRADHRDGGPQSRVRRPVGSPRVSGFAGSSASASTTPRWA